MNKGGATTVAALFLAALVGVNYLPRSGQDHKAGSQSQEGTVLKRAGVKALGAPRHSEACTHIADQLTTFFQGDPPAPGSCDEPASAQPVLSNTQPLPKTKPKKASPRSGEASSAILGWKVGFSDSAFPGVAQIKPAPGILCASNRFASALRALCCHILRPAQCRDTGLSDAPPFEEISPLPQRSSLRSGFYCPSPSTLNRPHPPHSRAHPDFSALRLIRDAFAVRVHLGDPRVVPCFRCMLLLDMQSSTTAGSTLAVYAQFLHQHRWPSPDVERFGTPEVPHHPLQMGRSFAASPVRYSLGPVKLLASLADPAGYFSRSSETFTSGLSTGRSPSPSLDITTVATEQVPPVGLPPTGTTASIAAPTSHSYDFFIHYTSPV